MSEVSAIAKNIRISPKKVLLLVDQIKKMNPKNAIDVLDYTPKSSSMPLKKVIKSAIANAKNNNGLDENSLKFKSIIVEKGSVLKRFRPISRGRAHAILKRTSNIRVTLEGEAKSTKEPKVAKAQEETKEKNEK